MAEKSSLKDKLLREHRRRQKLPRPVAIELGPVTAGRRAELTQNYSGLLFAVESGFVAAADAERTIDDAATLKGLASHLLGDPPADAATAAVMQVLASIRKRHSDLEFVDWRDLLRVVVESIRSRSKLAPGEMSYLAFAQEFTNDVRSRAQRNLD